MGRFTATEEELLCVRNCVRVVPKSHLLLITLAPNFKLQAIPSTCDFQLKSFPGSLSFKG